MRKDFNLILITTHHKQYFFKKNAITNDNKKALSFLERLDGLIYTLWRFRTRSCWECGGRR